MNRVDKTVGAVNLKQLSYFLALAEHGSISSAASALRMAQPSLSENIAKLERSMDTTLAIRGARGIQMTEAGLTLVKRGREILKSVSDMMDEVRLISGEPRGPLSLGLPPSLSALLSVPLAETVHHEHPDIRLHIAEALSGDILQWIASERLDLGCVYEISDPALYSFEPILAEELFLATAPDNWPGEIGPDGFALEPISADRLQELPLVLTSRSPVERLMRSSGLQLNVVSEIDSLVQILEMVGRASAYSLVSQGAVLRQVSEGRLALVPIEGVINRRTTYLVRSRTRPVSSASAIMARHITQIIGETVSRYNLRAAVPCDAPYKLTEFGA